MKAMPDDVEASAKLLHIFLEEQCNFDKLDCLHTLRAHIAEQASRIAELEQDSRTLEQYRKSLKVCEGVVRSLEADKETIMADNKRLRYALAPFAMAALKYRDIGDSPVADYIRKKTGLIAGYTMVFMPLCSASTSPKNWFEAADALAQTGGK